MSKFVFLALAALTATGFAHAQSDFVEQARVISIRPLVQSVPVDTQDCRPVAAPAATASGKSSLGLGALMGAVAGAALGNQLGNGNGKTVATVVGGVGGAIVGDNVQNPTSVGPQYQQQCTTRTFQEQRNVGYEVTYEYAGRTRTVQTQRDPGAQIQLRITPVI